MDVSDVILQVHATEDSLAAIIWHVHLLSKWRPTPCLLDKITRCTMRGEQQAWRQSLRFKQRGKVSLRGGPAWFSSGLRMLWHIVLWSRSSSVSGEPPVGVLAAAREVTASDNVIVCCGQGDEG